MRTTYRCCTCKLVKPLDYFYKNQSYSKGHSYRCKQCTYIAALAWQKTPEGKANRSARRSRLYHGSAEYREAQRQRVKNWYKTPAGKAYRKRDRKTVGAKARRALNMFISLGGIERPQSCEQCGTACSPHAHHHLGYEKHNWLKVRWLCVPCHRAIHNPTKKAQSSLVDEKRAFL